MPRGKGASYSIVWMTLVPEQVPVLYLVVPGYTALTTTYSVLLSLGTVNSNSYYSTVV